MSAIIGAVQIAALLYGAQSLFVARPAFIVFDADRFDVVTANELVRDAPFLYRDERFASTPIFRPIWVVATPPDSTEERNRLLFSAVHGGPQTKDHPALYQAWPPKQGINTSKLKPLRELASASDAGNQAVRDAVDRSGLPESDLAYVWLVGRAKIGVVILERKTLAIVLASAIKPAGDVK